MTADSGTLAEQVGWVLWDGDEYHGFAYYSPSEWKGPLRDALLRKGYLPVYVAPPWLGDALPFVAELEEDDPSVASPNDGSGTP